MPTPGFRGVDPDAFLRQYGDSCEVGGRFQAIETTPSNTRAKRVKPAEMAPALFIEDPPTWVIQIRLMSEMNGTFNMGAKMSRNKNVKESIYRAMGPHWRTYGPFGDRVRAGHPCVIRAIRLGGNGLDIANLWAAMKFPEDAIANLLGCSDGWPAWKRSFQVDQEPGPLWGLRVEMRLTSHEELRPSN